jgi:hypothetical protein
MALPEVAWPYRRRPYRANESDKFGTVRRPAIPRSAKFSGQHTHCVEPARYSAAANRNSPLWFGSRFGEPDNSAPRRWKTVTLLRTTRSRRCRCHGLKIRVSAVRFCPWPPVSPRPRSSDDRRGLCFCCGLPLDRISRSGGRP